MSDWQPLNDNVLIEPQEKAPEMYVGVIVAVGDMVKGVRKGDVVMVKRYACQQLFVDDKKLLLCREYRLCAKRRLF